MSQYKVKKLDHPIHCTVEVPGSKSITNRALLMAALSQGECTLKGVLFSDDSRHFLLSLIALGYIIEVNEVERYVIIHGHGRDSLRREQQSMWEVPEQQQDSLQPCLHYQMVSTQLKLLNR